MEVRLTYGEYAAALENDKIIGLQCASCGAKNAPPTIACRSCGGLELQTVPLTGGGKIVTLTSIFTPPEGVEAPYIVCLVQLDEGPRLIGNLLGVDPQTADIKLIGRPVSVSHLVRSGDKYSAGKMVSVAFNLA